MALHAVCAEQWLAAACAVSVACSHQRHHLALQLLTWPTVAVAAAAAAAVAAAAAAAVAAAAAAAGQAAKEMP